MNNMWSKGLDMKPYNIGFRFGGNPDKIKYRKSSSKKPGSFKWGATL
jgi:hypothetical protein